MHPGFLALISGGLIYIASAAAGAMQASGEVRTSAWLGVAAVALCHAAQGFLVIGDRSAVSQSIRTIFFRAGASALMTALVLAVAITAVSFFPLPFAPTTALGLVVVSVLASAVVLTLTARPVLPRLRLLRNSKALEISAGKNATAALLNDSKGRDDRLR